MSGWPDPEKPGVPANPERDGYHWVKWIWKAEVGEWKCIDGDGSHARSSAGGEAMSEPAKDEAELLERILQAIWDGCDESLAEANPAIDALAAIRAAGWAVVPARLTKDMEYDALRAENARLREALKNLLDRDERNTCQHEETHRGGFLWEICDVCGAKWADDMGGKTEWKDPPEWVAARDALEVKP